MKFVHRSFLLLPNQVVYTQPLGMQKHERVYRSRREIMLNNFLGGISWGVGSVIGATVVIAIIGIVIAQTQSVPFLGNIVKTTMDEIEDQTGKPLFEK